MNLERKYVVTMQVKYWHGGYDVRVIPFNSEAAFDKWWDERDDSNYKVIGIAEQGYKNI